jgi:hypothetical protein
MKREGETMSEDKAEREIRKGIFDELDNSKRPKISTVEVIDEKTKKEFFSLFVKGGQVFVEKEKNPEARNYEII